MTAILLCGRQDTAPDQALEQEICRVLSACGGVCRISEGVITLPDTCKFFLVQQNRPLRLRTESGVCVLPPEARPFARWRVPPGFVAVAPSDNPTALRTLERQGPQAVTCGMSASDTVTLSSLDENRPVVSLQRNLRTLSGEQAEPGEYPVRLAAPISPYGLMAAVSILLLAGLDPNLELGDRYI